MTSPESPSLDALAAGPIDAADRQALDAVARLYDTLDPVPAGLVGRIQFGITLDALNAEIAELQRSGDLVGVRSDNVTEAQTVTFTSASLTLMVTLTAVSADRVRIDGWVAPGAGVTVELRSVSGLLTTIADQDGRFVVEDVARGLIQFVVRPAGPEARPVITPSLDI